MLIKGWKMVQEKTKNGSHSKITYTSTHFHPCLTWFHISYRLQTMNPFSNLCYILSDNDKKVLKKSNDFTMVKVGSVVTIYQTFANN